jgi:carboxylesterase type B
VQHGGWSGTLDATQSREACAQFDSSGEMLGSEDCLYLNVFTRARSTSTNPFPSSGMPPYMNGPYPMDPFAPAAAAPSKPVLVFFHAESFESGDASLYGPEKLLDKEMILVTLNYRLGVLGYLSTEDDHAPGNLALHDQRMALIWIKKNIQHFGGDPNRITIGGQGAGAANVFDHLLSRWSSGLFHAAILQSGSGLCSWAREREPFIFAKKVAQRVGCTSEPAATKYDVNMVRNAHLPDSIQDKIRSLNRQEDPSFAAQSINRQSIHRQSPIKSNELSGKQIIDCLRQVPVASLLKAQISFKVGLDLLL